MQTTPAPPPVSAGPVQTPKIAGGAAESEQSATLFPLPDTGVAVGPTQTKRHPVVPSTGKPPFLSSLSVLSDLLLPTLLYWWSDLNTVKELGKGNEGQAGSSVGYDLAKACSASDFAAPQHAKTRSLGSR